MSTEKLYQIRLLLVLLVISITACTPHNYHTANSSMEPTFHIDDIFLALDNFYDFKTNSPKRGDVIIFQPQNDINVILIKRIIGLPRDHVQIKNGVLVLNGAPVRLETIKKITFSDYGTPIKAILQRETLPDGTSYNIMDMEYARIGHNTQEFVVPDNSYFVLGDNRDNSDDSRFSIDFVNQKNIVAYPYFILWYSGGGYDKRSRFLQP